jgi:uncharacterized membrane protein
VIALHPPFTSFPVPLLFTACAMEIAVLLTKRDSLKITVQILLLLAAIFTGLSFYTGYGASEAADQFFKIPNDVISFHHSIGRATLLCIIPLCAVSLLRSYAKYGIKFFSAVYILLLISTLLLAVYTGYLGGELVFKYGAGVAGK